jgi:hypothetical protein
MISSLLVLNPDGSFKWTYERDSKSENARNVEITGTYTAAGTVVNFRPVTFKPNMGPQSLNLEGIVSSGRMLLKARDGASMYEIGPFLKQ